MKLVEMNIKDFMQTLGSDEPAPGGGSASALAAAQGISLTKMVAELTVGKKKYAEYEEEMQKVLEDSTNLQKELVLAIDRDTEAFNEVSAVFAMPKETDEEKAARREAMQKALKIAAKTPYDVMEIILKSLEVTQRAVGKSNTNAASDLGVAALNLKAAMQGSWLNVLINLAGIKDEIFVEEYKASGEEILNKATKMADDIYSEVIKSL